MLRHLGTPTEESWPGHTDLPDFHKISFPESAGTPWPELLPGGDPEAINLVKFFVSYDEKKRQSAKEVFKQEKSSQKYINIFRILPNA